MIPAANARAPRAHVVFLGPLTRRILGDLPRAASGLVFPGRGDVPMTGWSRRLAPVSAAMSRTVQLHGLRRGYRTALADLRVDTDIAELMIAHARSGLEARYNVAELEEQRRGEPGQARGRMDRGDSLMDDRDLDAILAIQDFREAIARSSNLPLEKRQAIALGDMLAFVKRVFPDEVRSGVLESLVGIAEEMWDRAPTDMDPHGGNAVPATRETLHLLLSAAAHVLARPGGHLHHQSPPPDRGLERAGRLAEQLRRWASTVR